MGRIRRYNKVKWKVSDHNRQIWEEYGLTSTQIKLADQSYWEIKELAMSLCNRGDTSNHVVLQAMVNQLLYEVMTSRRKEKCMWIIQDPIDVLKGEV